MGLAQLPKRERTRICRRHAVRVGTGRATVPGTRVCLVAQFFIALRRQALDERVGLIGIFKVRERAGIIAAVKRYITTQVRKIGLLFGIGSFVQYCLGRGNVFDGIGQVPSASGDTGSGVVPSKVPQIAALGAYLLLLQSGIVTSAIPVVRRIEVADIEAQAP